MSVKSRIEAKLIRGYTDANLRYRQVTEYRVILVGEVQCITGYLFQVYINDRNKCIIRAGCFEGSYAQALCRWGKNLDDPRAKQHPRYKGKGADNALHGRAQLRHIHAILAYFKAARLV